MNYMIVDESAPYEMNLLYGNDTVKYYLGIGCLSKIQGCLDELDPDLVFVVTDATVYGLHGDELNSAIQEYWKVYFLIVPSGESCKAISVLSKIVEDSIDLGVSRKSVIVSFGGGAVGNIAGTLSALIFRGIALIHIPTTFLAMHDSVTSRKQAINAHGVKNILGTYHTPHAIVSDISFLYSLPDRQIMSGYVELVKNALILGGVYADYLYQLHSEHGLKSSFLLRESVRLGIEAKTKYIVDDAYEKKNGLMFEYGHTVGHAVEALFNGELTHGEAVAYGMRIAGEVSAAMGLMSRSSLIEHHNLLSLLGEIKTPHISAKINAIMNLIRKDNKKGMIGNVAGNVSMVLLKAIGLPVFSDLGIPLINVPEKVIYDAIASVRENKSA